MGLFMGMSVLSIIEVIYFCTVRLCCNSRKKHQKNKNKKTKKGDQQDRSQISIE